MSFAVQAGLPYPMGASITPEGVNFAVFSAHATQMTLCLFDPTGRHETALPFTQRSGDIWHMHVAGLGAGALYGLRAHGPYAPEEGHRFNAHKLLIDPYARGLFGGIKWADALMGYRVGAAKADMGFDSRDSARFVPKSVVIDPRFDWGADRPPRHAMGDTILYEAHVKSLTRLHPDIPPALRGTYAGIGHPAMIAHLQKLGVTAIELLPIQSFVDDRFLIDKGLCNHWGYNTIGFFVPEARYARQNPLSEVQQMVKSLHSAGIEVILDVVYNHTGESDQMGPTLSFRGLDNASYYRSMGRLYANDAGTGNTLDLTHPMVLRMVMDSLRYWVEHVHIDGFRFDLASVLGREAHGFDPKSGFFDALLQDPVLAGVKLIAEPWDLGPGGYQLGAYPAPFSEWNDRARDTFRRFWRGDAGMAPELSRRLLGSADQFDHSRRAPSAGINFITSHDGFTLTDLVSYSVKRNLANGEDNRDGHDDNHSANMGAEGPDAALTPARNQRKRNLLATLFLAQGTPMLLAGDEIGHSQGGNNNAYAQDNEISWLNWVNADTEMLDFTARLTALRADHAVLRHTRFLHGAVQDGGLPDVSWHRADGATPQPDDWHDAQFRCLALSLCGADMLYIVFNGGGDIAVTLPDYTPAWALILDTSRPRLSYEPISTQVIAPAQSVLVFKSMGAVA